MKYIKGFTFMLEGSRETGFAGVWVLEELKQLKADLGADTVIIAFQAVQETAHSEMIDFSGSRTPSDDELRAVIGYAKQLGFRVILKPMVNCLNGEWRAYINFIDPPVICEPKWGKWFESYDAYLLHYADIAEETGCGMMIIGCELVMAQGQEQYWRDLISLIREKYSGLLTVNVDKYQEDRLTWWDALDVMSSSGYYPSDAWEENLDRIEKAVERFDKPFFFAECGCPCRHGASAVPNDWTRRGAYDVNEQAEYYRKMFEAGRNRKWLRGYSGWAWGSHDIENIACCRDGYSVYGKPSAAVIKRYYMENSVEVYE